MKARFCSNRLSLKSFSSCEEYDLPICHTVCTKLQTAQRKRKKKCKDGREEEEERLEVKAREGSFCVEGGLVFEV